jgi:hypothetical protein
MFIVNCSWIIKTGWAIVKGFLDPKTVSKITILGDAYQKELLECVAAEDLPSFLGGTCQCQPVGCLGQNEGHWKAHYDFMPKEDDTTNDEYPPFPPRWVNR